MSRRILVVDDDASTRFVLSRLLTREGYAVEHAASVAQALEQLSTAAFDVLLTDFVMPNGSGGDLVDEAMRLYPTLRCLIMSGHPRAAETASSVLWLDKPLDIEQLLTMLAT